MRGNFTVISTCKEKAHIHSCLAKRMHNAYTLSTHLQRHMMKKQSTRLTINTETPNWRKIRIWSVSRAVYLNSQSGWKDIRITIYYYWCGLKNIHWLIYSANHNFAQTLAHTVLADLSLSWTPRVGSVRTEYLVLESSSPGHAFRMTA